MTGLPKKDWLQLGEVASRWNCRVDDLLHYAWQDRLRVSVVFTNPARVEWSDLDAVRDITLEDGPLALVSDAFLSGKPKGGFSAWSLRPPVLGQNDLWGKPVEGGPWSADQPKIRQRDLIIAREEVERFERLHELGDHATSVERVQTVLPVVDARSDSELNAETAPAQPPATVARPLPQQRHQEQEILRVLVELGYAPAALPKAQPGKAGPKAQARKKLPEFHGTVFDKAWERLRSARQIGDAE